MASKPKFIHSFIHSFIVDCLFQRQAVGDDSKVSSESRNRKWVTNAQYNCSEMSLDKHASFMQANLKKICGHGFEALNYAQILCGKQKYAGNICAISS